MGFANNSDNTNHYHPKCTYIACRTGNGCAYGLTQCVVVNGPYSLVPALTRVERALQLGDFLTCPDCGGKLKISCETYLICDGCTRTWDAQEICRINQL